PRQDPTPTRAAAIFAAGRGMDVHAVPMLAELFSFVTAYAGELGRQTGKNAWQQAQAARLRFDLELKRVPFFPQAINDGFDGRGPGQLERKLVQIVQSAGVVTRTTVRSFDHRSVGYALELEPGLVGAV